MKYAIKTILSATLLASCILAQTGSVVVSSTYRPKSVHPTPSGNVICSMIDSGRQITVDATVVAAPVVIGVPFNPIYSDQFGNSVYTPQFGGRLLSL